MRSALSALVLSALAVALAPRSWAAAPDEAPARAGARPAPSAPAPEDPTAEARARFRKGSELYRQARYRDAIAEFEGAYRLRPHGVIFFNLAQCHERLGDIPAALQAYHRYLREVPDAEDQPTVHAAMSNLEARLGASGVQQLLVYSDPAGAEVLVDGQSKGRTPMALVLPHGNHAVSLVRQGYRTSSRQVVLSPQSSLALDIVLQKLEPGELAGGAAGIPTPTPTATATTPSTTTGTAAATPTGTPSAAGTGATGAAPRSALEPPPAPRAQAKGGKRWTWVAAGAAVAALGAGTYYGVKQRSTERDYLAGKGDPSQMLARSKDQARSANTLFLVSGGLAAGAGALFLVEGRF